MTHLVLELNFIDDLREIIVGQRNVVRCGTLFIDLFLKLDLFGAVVGRLLEIFPGCRVFFVLGCDKKGLLQILKIDQSRVVEVHTRTGLIDDINGLVRQVTLVDVALRQIDRVFDILVSRRVY